MWRLYIDEETIFAASSCLCALQAVCSSLNGLTFPRVDCRILKASWLVRKRDAQKSKRLSEVSLCKEELAC